ncbi:MAG: periplasmic heavy metal sensor [Pseudomonadota bacterium]
MGRGLMIALFASLGLNVFAIGVLSGKMFSGPSASAPPVGVTEGLPPPNRILRHAAALPPESRKLFRDAFRDELPALRGNYREMRQLRAEMRALAAADDWDSAAIAKKMAEIREVQTRQQQAFDAALLAGLEVLPTEDRQMLARLADQDRGRRGRDRRERRRERLRDRFGPERQ